MSPPVSMSCWSMLKEAPLRSAARSAAASVRPSLSWSAWERPVPQAAPSTTIPSSAAIRRRMFSSWLLQPRYHDVEQPVGHLALGHALEVQPRAVTQDEDTRVVVHREADVGPADVVGEDGVQALARQLLLGLGDELCVLGREADQVDALGPR